MKSLLDIHVALATAEDMDVWEERAETAADRLNDLLFMLYDRAPEDAPVAQLEHQIQKIWEIWREDEHLFGY